jgi:hypothetical protein
MKVDIINVPPVPPPTKIEKVVITLDRWEAHDLAVLMAMGEDALREALASANRRRSNRFFTNDVYGLRTRLAAALPTPEPKPAPFY